jgi:hypothetical protein
MDMTSVESRPCAVTAHHNIKTYASYRKMSKSMMKMKSKWDDNTREEVIRKVEKK